MLKEVLKIMFGMIFTQNYVLVQFIAICPFLGVSKKFDSCIGMSGAVIFVMTLASAVTHLIYQYVMVPNGLEYLSTIIFILVIAALVQFVEIFLKKYVPPLYKSLGVYLPLITTNCAVLAVTLLNVTNGYMGSEVICKLFLVNPTQSWQIDSSIALAGLDPNKFMLKQLLITFKTVLTPFRQTFANYEGMCLGARLADGRQTLLMVSDSQGGASKGPVRLKDWIKVLILPDGI